MRPRFKRRLAEQMQLNHCEQVGFARMGWVTLTPSMQQYWLNMSEAATAVVTSEITEPGKVRKAAISAIKDMLGLAAEFSIGIKAEAIADVVLKDIALALRGES